MGVVLAFPIASQRHVPNDRERVVTSAVIRAADWLGIDDSALAEILTLTRRTMQHLRVGGLHLTENSNGFNRAVNLVAVFSSLHIKFAADREIARSWMRNSNTALHHAPIALMQKPGGLEAVRAYVERASIP
ncbi:MbcA/ParS/Xre antitoxin family protein [Mesorhizobium sp. SP-1A]|uniref:MbcA/ParS/Xre antitoxin family protein n=1 Tax=Mesorhizobium sp. SP-1A TaxID=3077840 RepID=UPI0028F73317|nr:MbcA/ParS/Xre antitoxin family protein [Mesorhizobium sp. SP-1A]